jgi:hypothetical protein
METERKASAPYLPLATFLTALDHLKAIRIPNTIDGATFPNMSSQSKSQTLSALRFFELINDTGKPQPFLSELAYEEGDRKALIKQLIEKYYPDIVALNFSTLTPAELDKALSGSRYNVGGETRKKAKTFLLRAAQHAGFTVHPLLTKITRNRKKGTAKEGASGTGKANQTDDNGSADTSADRIVQHAHKPHGSEKTVKLKSGAGSVTLSIDVDLLELEPGEERDFVLKLRDMFRAYEKGLTSLTEGNDKVEKEAGE